MKPILFNTDMVRAILDGRKTETRRLPSKRIEDKWLDYEEWVTAVATPDSKSFTEKEYYEQYLPYQPGSILYVRESYCPNYFDEGIAGYRSDDMRGNRNAYKADYRKEVVGDYVPEPKWTQSIHMPKEAARIFIRVTDVRVERLQDMPHDAPAKEGIHYCECPDGWFTWKSHTAMQDCYINPMRAMEALWNSTVKKSDIERYGWDANPWVYVISFERISKEEAMKGETT